MTESSLNHGSSIQQVGVTDFSFFHMYLMVKQSKETFVSHTLWRWILTGCVPNRREVRLYLSVILVIMSLTQIINLDCKGAGAPSCTV